MQIDDDGHKIMEFLVFGDLEGGVLVKNIWK